jgi:hypothetical protein
MGITVQSRRAQVKVDGPADFVKVGRMKDFCLVLCYFPTAAFSYIIENTIFY